MTACRVFVCYRRADTGTVASPLADKLASRFGSDNVFLDLGLAPGDDFWEEIQRFLRGADVMLVLIGSAWLETSEGHRRLSDRADYVRREILLAWENGKRVMPVLVQTARMPAPRDLPRTLRRIAKSHALELHTDTWARDTDIIIDAIKKHVDEVNRGRYAWLQEIQAQAPASALMINSATRPANWVPLVVMVAGGWWLQASWLWAAAALVYVLLCATTFFDVKVAKTVGRTRAARGDH